MANVTVKTTLINVTDNQSISYSTAAIGSVGAMPYKYISLDGVPNEVATLITNKTLTPNTNYAFAKPPHVSFVKTNEPNRYSYDVTKNNNGSYSFTVKYLRPMSPPTTDIIEFFAEAKTNMTVTGDKIYDWTMSIDDINPNGESRNMFITGDPGAEVKMEVTQTPTTLTTSTLPATGLFPNTQSVDIIKEYVVTIGVDGKSVINIPFPSVTYLAKYTIKFTEVVTGSFDGGMFKSPTTISLNQWPLQQTKLEILETSDTTWVAPFNAAGINNTFFYYSGHLGQTSYKQDFSFTCTHANPIGYSVTDTTDNTAGAFTGTTMICDTNHNHSTKNIAIGDVISGANIVTGTTITHVNVHGNLKKYTISQAPSAEVADSTTITFTRPSFTSDKFTQVTGQGATASDMQTSSIVTYDNLKTEISGTSVVISGQITVRHGYDHYNETTNVLGYTYITLNINDILNHL